MSCLNFKDTNAPDNKGTIKSLEDLHQKKNDPFVIFSNDTASIVFQFCKKYVNEQFITFKKHTVAEPSKMNPDHLLHSLQRTASDQSESALKSLA